ncbi:MAG: hypothetical protein H7338_20975 [Candidatus Sericytochromatia bacterium]|nr:hypothetical protein [Candidatus Sericytochromatia bacterium]
MAGIDNASAGIVLGCQRVRTRRVHPATAGFDAKGSGPRDWINRAFQSSSADAATPGTYAKGDKNMPRPDELDDLDLTSLGRGLGTKERL